LTQAGLSRRTGVSISTISLIECGISVPQKETQEKIAAVFNINPEVIFDESPALKKQRPLCDDPSPPLLPVERKHLTINCRWCHGQIQGLIWNPKKCELIVKKMPRPARVHDNGFFYHEDCLKEKMRAQAAFPRPPEK
jgi:transcriptional regulator with XRE-family HTH domain